jgi:hypothetical protein
MSLKDKVRAKFDEAKRLGNQEEKNLLSVILGDIATAEARSGKELPEPEVEKLLRKMVESNTEGPIIAPMTPGWRCWSEKLPSSGPSCRRRWTQRQSPRP